VREAYRTTGLSHLLAISGMQMTLVGLGLFGLIRWLGAWWPWLALRVNLKAWAAALSLLGVVAYTLLVGAAPSVVRASLMVGLVLLAVILGRLRSVLRAWAVAVGLILLAQPHLALSAGLQLSAVATLALALWVALADTAPPQGIIGWARATLLATLVAGAATAPVLALHFGAPAVMGIVANSVAIPLMTLASYAGFVALALWPFGLAPLALAPMGWLVALSNAWAGWLASWQSSWLPPLGPLEGWGVAALAGVAVATLGLTVLRRWGWLAILTILGTLALAGWGWWGPRPSLLVTEGGASAWVALPNAHPAAAPLWRLAWAEDPARAAWLARVAKLPLAADDPSLSLTTAQSIPCCADESLMPQTSTNFAYAQKVGATWQIIPQRCARPWQQIAQACWEQGDNKPDLE